LNLLTEMHVTMYCANMYGSKSTNGPPQSLKCQILLLKVWQLSQFTLEQLLKKYSHIEKEHKFVLSQILHMAKSV
jgi:hypothetical protein